VEAIAQRAQLSSGTVRDYLSSAVGKVGATNRGEALRIAHSYGWI
jgi:two-component system, NarL family, response regulator DesR